MTRTPNPKQTLRKVKGALPKFVSAKVQKVITPKRVKQNKDTLQASMIVAYENGKTRKATINSFEDFTKLQGEVIRGDHMITWEHVPMGLNDETCDWCVCDEEAYYKDYKQNKYIKDKYDWDVRGPAIVIDKNTFAYCEKNKLI